MYSFRLRPNLQTSLIVSWEKLNKNYQYELVFNFIISVNCLNLRNFCREKMKVVWKFGLNQNRVHLTKNGQLAHKLKGVSACWGGGFNERGGIGRRGGVKQFTFLKYNGYIFKWDSNKVFKILRIYAQIIKTYQLKLKIY